VKDLVVRSLRTYGFNRNWLAIFVLSCAVLSHAPLVQAATTSFTITCKNKGTCEHSHPGAAFFTAQNIVPGTVLERPVTIRNQQNKEGCRITIRGSQSQTLAADLAQALELRITTQTAIVRSYPLTTVLQTTTPLVVDTINPKTNRDYIWQLVFNQNSGNQYQGSLTTFDFNLIFTCDETTRELVPTPTPIASPTLTPTPSCTTPPPPAPVLSLEQENNHTKVTLRWQKVAAATSYQLSFATTDQSLRYENTDVGNTTQFTVTGLHPQYDYTFFLRAVKGCAIGPASAPVILARDTRPITPVTEQLEALTTGTIATAATTLTTGSVLGASIEVPEFTGTGIGETPPDEVVSSEGALFFLIFIGLFMLFAIVRRKKHQKSP